MVGKKLMNFVSMSLDTYEHAEGFLISRRRLLPAIYNYNLERYHCFDDLNKTQDGPTSCIKTEPDTVAFLDEPGLIIVLDDSNDESDFDDDIGPLQFHETSSDIETDPSNDSQYHLNISYVNHNNQQETNVRVANENDSGETTNKIASVPFNDLIVLGQNQNANDDGSVPSHNELTANVPNHGDTQVENGREKSTDDTLNNNSNVSFNTDQNQPGEFITLNQNTVESVSSHNKVNKNGSSHSDTQMGSSHGIGIAENTIEKRNVSLDVVQNTPNESSGKRNSSHAKQFSCDETNVSTSSCTETDANVSSQHRTDNGITQVLSVKKEIVFPNEPDLTIDVSDEELEVIREIMAYDSDEDPEIAIESEYNLLPRPKTILKSENDSFDLVTGKLKFEINVSVFIYSYYVLVYNDLQFLLCYFTGCAGKIFPVCKCHHEKSHLFIAGILQ